MGEQNTGDAAQALTQLEKQYMAVLQGLEQTVGRVDTRSYDLAVTRLEESLMWAARGLQQHTGRQHTGASPAPEEPGNDDTQQ